MFTDAADGTRPVGRDRRGFLKELGLGGIARERRLSCRRLGAAAFLLPASVGEGDNHFFSPVHSCHSVFSLSGFIHVH